MRGTSTAIHAMSCHLMPYSGPARQACHPCPPEIAASEVGKQRGSMNREENTTMIGFLQHPEQKQARWSEKKKAGIAPRAAPTLAKPTKSTAKASTRPQAIILFQAANTNKNAPDLEHPRYEKFMGRRCRRCNTVYLCAAVQR